MPYSAKQIANFFIERAAQDGGAVTPMKLQKLVYYAHGWYAGHTSKPLINEAVEAWQFGPVIPSLYHEFKRFGSGPITAKAREIDLQTFQQREAPLPDDAVRTFLDNVWKSYGVFTGIRLSEMTHAADSPWDRTWKQNQGMRSVDIPFEEIRSHFAEAVQKSAARASQ